MSEKILPNKIGILSHLEFLFKDTNGGKIEIAYTPKDSGAVCNAEYFDAGQINGAAEFAYAQNMQEGVNVYVGAALRKGDTAPFGRSNAKDYLAATSVWCDLDDADSAKAAKDKYKDLPPSFVVVTGRHPDLRAQVWWRLDTPESDPIEHKKTLANVCAALSGDKAVVDPARVMRLGGSVAWPKKAGRIPELTEIITPHNATKSVTKEAFKSYFPAAEMPLTPKAVGGVGHNPLHTRDEWSIDQVCDMLNHIHPDGEYMDWVSVGMALKDYGISFDIWNAWSSKGVKYPGGAELYKKWQSFKGRGVGIGTLYYHAHNGGYHPSKYRQAGLPKITHTEAFDPDTGEILPDKQNAPQTPKNGKVLPLVFASDITPILDTADFVQGLLRDHEFSVIYGQSNCGKTFFMLDLAMHVALGAPWRGREVEQGGVIYAALEGGHGTKNRITAFKNHYEITRDIPLAVIPASVNFLDGQTDMPAFIEAVKAAQTRLGNVRLIVIDTLARAISGGDENSSMDMGQLIINADIVRAITGAHIAFVHHSGKDEVKGARGHSSLRAAVDTEIEISRPDAKSPSIIKIVKQREMEMIEEMAFTLKRVELGIDRRGNEVSSCIVMPCENSVIEKQVRMTPLQQFVYDALVEAILRHGQSRKIHKDMPPVDCVLYDELKVVMEERGFREMMDTSKKSTAAQIKSATQTARLALKKAGKINFDYGYIWIVRND